MAEACTSCPRPVYGKGLVLIEGAFQADGTCVVHEALLDLQLSSNDEEQDRFYDLEARFVALSLHGSLEQPKHFRPLHTIEGLWEIKTSTDRVGCYRASHIEVSEHTLRLTHLWKKDLNKTSSGKTPRRQLNFGDKIIREDREYADRKGIER